MDDDNEKGGEHDRNKDQTTTGLFIWNELETHECGKSEGPTNP